MPHRQLGNLTSTIERLDLESAILTPQQQEQITQRAADARQWRDEADLERRRGVSRELRRVVEHGGVLTGETLSARQLCELVALQWQVQNLNPMQMPRLLGLYAYKVHFGGFQGTPEDLSAQRKEETGDPGFYAGADLDVISEAIRLMMADSVADQARGAMKLLGCDGAGPAFVSGFLHFLHPGQYGMVNAVTQSPFTKNGLLPLTLQQRKQARQTARALIGNADEIADEVVDQIFQWEMLLKEVLQICGFDDFHELDQFFWGFMAGPIEGAEERLQPIMAEIMAHDVAVRVEAEKKARQLIEANLGNLSAEQFSELFTLLNTCMSANRVFYSRFAPAFMGRNANLIIKNAPAINAWIQKLWTAKDDDVPQLLSRFWSEAFPGAGRSLPTAILYLRDNQRYAVWTANLEKALYSVVSGLPAKLRTGFGYLQYCQSVHQLRTKTGFPPEMHDWVLFRLLKRKPTESPAGQFPGFEEDAFQFFVDLRQNKSEWWFDEHRSRYRKSVDQPMRALFKDLAENVVTPLDPDLETAPKKCISKVNRKKPSETDGAPAAPRFHAAFFRKDLSRETDGRLFVSLDAQHFTCGIDFGEGAEDVRADLVESITAEPKLARAVFDSLRDAGFLLRLGHQPEAVSLVDVGTFDAFVDHVKSERFQIYRQLTPEEAIAKGSELKEAVGNDFRRLYPLLRMATPAVETSEIWKLLGGTEPDEDGPEGAISTADLAAATFLEESFFTTLDQYLADKKQFIFCGPPGTGKTYVALEYAEYLSQDGGDVRTVQFHPSYGYEDFVEGFRPVLSKTGTLSYQVEDGIFKRVCNEARTNPKATYVLLIDEINRGNIPKIFGELLFLLEHRDRKTELPYSKKPFSIPWNVIVLGTMNSTDRSIALMDLALRRRFHFIEMQPRSDVLLGWLKANQKPRYVRDLFERLNEALRKAGIDHDRLVGHAHFMSQQLDDDYLQLIWMGTIEPLLKEYFFAEPEKLADFRLESFQAVIEEAVAFEETMVDEDEMTMATDESEADS